MSIWRGLALAGLATMSPAPLLAVEAVEEVLRQVPYDSGYFDLEFEVAPEVVATVSTSNLAKPNTVVATLQAGNADPFVESPSRVFRMAQTPLSNDRLLHAEVEGGGPGVDLYLGLDSDGDRQPDPDEVTCHVSDVRPTDACLKLISGNDQWVMLHRRSGAAVETRLHWYFMYYGNLRRNDVSEFITEIAAVSAPGRSDVMGRFPVRFSYTDSGMGDGDMRLARIRVVAGNDSIERTIRLVRTGSQTRQFSPGWQRTIRLAPGQLHSNIPFVVPVGSRSAGFYLEVVGQGNVGYWIRPTAQEWSGPILPAAPSLDLPGAYAATPMPNNPRWRSLYFEGEAGGLWHAVPVNYNAYPISVRVFAGAGHDPDNIPPLLSGSYYNPERPGHGLFSYRSGVTPVLLWYTYDDNGNPTWYYVQGGRSGGATLIYRAAWVGNRQRLYPVGRLVLQPGTDGSVVLVYEIDGVTGFETLQPFLSGCPSVAGQQLDVSGHWFDPLQPGTGFSVQVHPGYEFIAAYVYDALGSPRFLVAERGGPFRVDDEPLLLEQLQGFALLGEHQVPVREPVGLLRRRYVDGVLAEVSLSAQFTGSIEGSWESQHDVRLLADTQGCAP